MFDQDTLIVAYDEKRGERSCGRCKPEKGMLEQEQRIDKGVGDCIDCGYCVQVCPVGIDIRNGMQYQCITCALCVDACNTIMSSIKYPTGLIRYTSENELQGKRTNWFKFKNIGYAVAILVVIGLLSWSISHRSLLEMSVHQVRQPLYVMLSDGSIQNRYTIKINNKQPKTVTYRLTVKELPNAHWEVRPTDNIRLGPSESASFEVRVWLKPGEDTEHDKDSEHDKDFEFVLEQEGTDKPLVSSEVDFYIPHSMR